MKFFIVTVLVFYLSSANSTFWFRNDFERVIDTYKNTLPKDYFPYLRALSIYKRKLQLLGFYPIVLNDDGLEYVSLEPYIIEDDYDDQMYELLKKLKKEKKSRRKLLKKQMKKLKKETSTIPTTTTIEKPITNIVSSLPLAITTNPKTDENSNSFQKVLVSPFLFQSLNFKTYDEDSKEAEDNSEELDDFRSDTQPAPVHKSNQPHKENEFKKSETMDSQSGSILLTKLIIGSNDDRSNSESTDQIAERNISFTEGEVNGSRKINETDMGTTTTTTPYPIPTIFPDPDDKLIQEIVDPQEIVNKISDEGQENKTVKETIPTTVNYIEFTTLSRNPAEGYFEKVGDDLSQKSTTRVESVTLNEEDVSQTTESKCETEIEIENDLIQHSKQGARDNVSMNSEKNESHIQPNGIIGESDSYLEPTTDDSKNIVDLSNSISPGALDFFLDSPSDHDKHLSSNNSSSYFKIPVNISISTSTENPIINSKITEAAETTETIDRYLEIHSKRNDSNLPLNETASPTNQPLGEHLTFSKKPAATNKIPNPTDKITQGPSIHDALSSESVSISREPETSPQTNTESLYFSIDPRQLGDIFDTTDAPAVTETLDDFHDQDTTENLPYNTSSENLLEQSNVIEDTSAETSTQQPKTDPQNLDASDEIDGEIMPLIPIIIKQLKLGNVSPEEMEIIKNTFGQFWPIILKEAQRELDSSEEMNPILTEALKPVRRRVVKREATYGRFRRPILSRRIYYDDLDDYENRRYVGRLRRRPVIEYYYK